MSRIIIVSDSLPSSELLIQELQQVEHQVSYYCDAESVVNALQHQSADLLVLDQHKPPSETPALIKTLCESLSLPILLLAPVDNELDALDCIEAGADQYIIKPFSNKALLIHIDALLRRVSLEKQRLRFKNCTQYLSAKISRLPLTETEMLLTQYLSKNDGAIVSKATLQKEVLKKEISAFDRNLDVHISNIRRKMLNAGLSKLLIKTVHGKGYTFCGNVANLSFALLCFF